MSSSAAAAAAAAVTSAPGAAGDGTVEAADLLVVILDTNPFAWHASAQPDLSDKDNVDNDDNALTFDQALKSVLVLSNAHMAMRHENQLAVYSAGIGESSLLYSSFDAQRALLGNTAIGKAPGLDEDSDEDTNSGNAAGDTAGSDSNSYQTFRIVDEGIAKGLRENIRRHAQREGGFQAGLQDKPVAFSSALSKALCHINRLSKDETLAPFKARILVISVSGETSVQYIPIMNCIFAAQKASIPIDVCKLTQEPTVFLQQASHLTKASYYTLERRSGLLQYLLMAFLPGAAARKYLHLPSQEQIDLRAACFCHKRITDIGYVCSVCLSIFCSPIPVCTTCRTRFPIASLRRLMGSGGAAFGGAGAGAGSPAATAGPGTGGRKRKVPPAGAAAAVGRNGSPGPGTPAGTPRAKPAARTRTPANGGSSASRQGTPTA